VVSVVSDDAEGRLIQQVALGDRGALEALYAQAGPTLLRYLLHFTADRGVAEEILQDVLVAIWQNAHSYAGRSAGRGWLFGIARRRALKRLRRSDPLLLGLELAGAMPASEPEPEAALLAACDRANLRQAIDQLSEIHREVLVLTFVLELSLAEVAEVVGVPIGTVKSRLHHARRDVRRLLHDAGGGEP
jgi:RNA polymerase sigma-70 factor (ECF subfamily)